MPGASKKHDAIEAQRRALNAVNPAYAAAARNARAERQLTRDVALQEKTLREELRKLSGHDRQPEAEELIERGIELEDAGRLLDACRLYEKVLASEPDNWELRQYIQGLSRRINLLAAHSKASSRQESIAASGQGRRSMAARAEFEARINGPFGAGSLLQPDLQSRGGPVGGPAVGRRPGKTRVEQPVALTPEQYRAELAQQAQEAKARKAAARVAEKLADKREVEEQLRRGALEKYDAHVGRRNDKLSAKVELDQHARAARDRRQENYRHQQADLAHVPGGIFGGDGSHDMKVQAAQQRQWASMQKAVQSMAAPAAAGAAPRVAATSSSGPEEPVYVFGSTDWIHDAGAATGSSSHAYPTHVPPDPNPSVRHAVHSIYPGPGDHEVERQARYPGIARAPPHKASVPRSTAAPFGRPGVDAPVPGIEPGKVHRHMDAWVAKHKKRESPPQKQYSPGNHQRPHDTIGFRADRVKDQLNHAAARGTLQLAKYQ